MTKRVFISGGGPTGLAAALLFHDLGWDEIVVAERCAGPDEYEKNKSFTYIIEGRGQKLLSRLGLIDMLADYTLPHTGFTRTNVAPDGGAKVFENPFVMPGRITTYWAFRPKLLRMLFDAIEARNDGRIRLMYGATLTGLESMGEGAARVHVETMAGESLAFEADFVLGCDGIGSVVRKEMARLSGAPDRFEMVRHASPNTGLTYKVLNLPPVFPVEGELGEVADHKMAYMFQSPRKGTRQALKLFTYPVGKAGWARSANIMRPSEHELWTCASGEEVYRLLDASFPQLNIREIISKEEAEDFAALPPGRFPAPQYAKHVYGEIGKDGAHGLLLGDAARVFPPDMGVGVNTALEDLFVFENKLQEKGGDIAAACAAYEETRVPENAAIVRLSCFVHPYQYGHKPLKEKLWRVQFIFRLLMNRIAPVAFDKPGVVLIQDHRLAFREIEERIKKTNRAFMAVGAVLAASVGAAFAFL